MRKKVSLEVRFARSLRVVSRPELFVGYHFHFFLPIGIIKFFWCGVVQRSSSDDVWPSDLNDVARAIGNKGLDMILVFFCNL